MKVKIKTLEELVKGHPSAYVPIRVGLLAGQEVDTAEYIALEPWMYTEIKPEEVTAYGYIYDSGEIVWYDTADCKEQYSTDSTLRRAERYNIVFKGEE